MVERGGGPTNRAVLLRGEPRFYARRGPGRVEAPMHSARRPALGCGELAARQQTSLSAMLRRHGFPRPNARQNAGTWQRAKARCRHLPRRGLLGIVGESHRQDALRALSRHTTDASPYRDELVDYAAEVAACPAMLMGGGDKSYGVVLAISAPGYVLNALTADD